MRIETFEAETDCADSPRKLWELLIQYFHDTVVERVLYHHLPPLGVDKSTGIGVVADGFPEEMVARYVGESLYRRNPLLAHSQKSVEPFYLDEIDRLRPLSASEKEWVEEVRSAGLSDGLGVQVFGPGGRNGYFGLGFGKGAKRVDPADIPRIQTVCQLSHLRYCGQILSQMAPLPTLSEREGQILIWVARGKSNAEIAMILGISAYTVDSHLRRMYLKLGVFDRVTAAVRDIGIGLIHSEL